MDHIKEVWQTIILKQSQSAGVLQISGKVLKNVFFYIMVYFLVLMSSCFWENKYIDVNVIGRS